MIKFTKRQVIMLHEQLVQETGGESGLRDESLLESALFHLSNPLMIEIYSPQFKLKQPDLVTE